MKRTIRKAVLKPLQGSGRQGVLLVNIDEAPNVNQTIETLTRNGWSNMHAGGTAEAVKITDEMLRLVEMVRPKLLSDGMVLVGLDIVGDKLMEANVFSPGGLGSARAIHDVDFATAVIRDLENKLDLRESYGS